MTVNSIQDEFTPEKIEFFRNNEYLILRNVVPENLLDGLQKIMERWVNRQIKSWIKKGFLKEDIYKEEPFNQRMLKAWVDAGKPEHDANPTQAMVSTEVYDLLTFPGFIHIAQTLFNSPNIVSNSGFHCRPNLPNQSFTDTPWHQDAQCIPNLVRTNFLILWIPMMDVDENNACLQCAPGKQHQGNLFKKYNDPNGYYVSLAPEDSNQLENLETLRMKRGDILLFNEMLPHRALPNYSDAIRWSFDFRYHEIDNPAVKHIKNQTFVCAHEDPTKIESYELWTERMKMPLVIPGVNE